MAALFHRLYAFIIMLAIVVSLTGAGAWLVSGDMASAAGMADVSSQTCDEADCPDHEMTGAACYAACGGTLAVFSTNTKTDLWTVERLDPAGTATPIGQTSPPDPSPPRSSILS